MSEPHAQPKPPADREQERLQSLIVVPVLLAVVCTTLAVIWPGLAG
jgi:hypothetical protein